MPNLHPLVVHFPIALLTCAYFFDVLAIGRDRPKYSNVGWWMQVAGSIGLLFTLATGLQAKSSVSVPLKAVDTLQVHEQLAFVVAVLFLVLLLQRIGARSMIPERSRGLYWAAYSLGVILLWVTAWYGGGLVYDFGVGVAG